MSKFKVTGKNQITFVLQWLHWYSLGCRIMARVRPGCCERDTKSNDLDV